MFFYKFYIFKNFFVVHLKGFFLQKYTPLQVLFERFGPFVAKPWLLCQKPLLPFPPIFMMLNKYLYNIILLFSIYKILQYVHIYIHLNIHLICLQFQIFFILNSEAVEKGEKMGFLWHNVLQRYSCEYHYLNIDQTCHVIWTSIFFINMFLIISSQDLIQSSHFQLALDYEVLYVSFKF